MKDSILPTTANVEDSSVYRCTVKVENVDNYTALKLTGKNKDGSLILNRDLKSDGEISTIFFTKDKPECLNIQLTSKCKKPINTNKTIKYFRLEKVGCTQKNIKLNTSQDTICAAIATYPARQRSLLITIDSLINQVDYLLLYLNEYQEIPLEIKEHSQRNKIICIIDETGNRRAEAKFHWLQKTNGYYLTCDDDIIYPENYVFRTVSAIDKHNRKKVVGYHGIIFKKYVASFKADRKEFYKFTETVKEDKVCHLLGTGVSGFHTSLFTKVNSQILNEYPYAVDPAFAVICKKNNIEMLCLSHEEGWLESSPYMLYGLHEEKQNFKDIKNSVNKLLTNNSPWGGYSIFKPFAYIKLNAKFRKLINNPRQFFKDSYLGSKIK
ncbi:glycosyltransferase [Endozoicomonas sp. ALD040]|uniref:glycosyltransferase n=1 Tax=Endozoicomonas sp. ALD040 TaxID=3403079 RepID=UPI003BAECFEA